MKNQVYVLRVSEDEEEKTMSIFEKEKDAIAEMKRQVLEVMEQVKNKDLQEFYIEFGSDSAQIMFNCGENEWNWNIEMKSVN